MADGTVKISTELDGKGIKTGLSESQKTVRKTFEELAKESGKTVEELKADAKKIAEEYQKQGCDIPNSYKKAYKDMGVSSSKASKEVVDDAEKMADAHEDSSKKSKIAWKEAFSAIGGFAEEGLVLAGKVTAGAITATAGAISAGVGASIKVGAAFESEMSKVQAISGVTGDELAQLTEKAKEMGKKTKFSASESAQAFEYMVMAGWKTDDMLNSIDGVMNLAAASGEDLASVSDIVTDAMTAMGLAADGTTTIVKDGYTKEVSNAAHFADVLAAASSNSNTNVAMMGETFKYAAPLAGALGYSVEDLAQAIGLMANSGIKGSEAGTALRSILTRLAKPPKEAAEAMEQYGISMKNSDGSMKSLMGVMENMRDSLQGLPEDEQAAAAAAIGGQEAMSGLLAIVNASESDFKKLADAIDNADGSAEQMADIMQNNLSGQLTVMKSAAEALGIEIYQSIQQPLTDLAREGGNAINDLIDAFENGGIQGLITVGSQIITNVISGIAEQLPNLITMSVQVIQCVIDNINANFPQIAAAGGQILTALVDGIAQLLPSLGSLAINIGQKIVSALKENLPSLLSTGSEMLRNVGNGVRDAIPEFLSQALPVAADFSANLRSAAGRLVDDGIAFIQNIWSGLISALPDLIAYVPTIVDNVAGIINDNVPKLIIAGASMIQELIVGIVENIPTLIENFPKIVQSIFSVIQAVSWADLGRKIISGIAGGVQSLASSLVEGVKSIGQNAYEKFRGINWSELGIGLIKKILSGITSLVTSIPSKLTDIGKAAVNAFKNISWTSVGTNIILGITSGIASAAGNLVNAAVNAAKNAIDTVKGWLGIHSPSRRARDEIGVQMIAGIGEGVEQETPQLEQASEDSIKSSVKAMKRASASKFVADMQAESFRAAENNEMAAREQARTSGYDPETEDDGEITIVNQFYVDGDKLVEKTVKKTKRQIEKETRAARLAKGDVAFA